MGHALCQLRYPASEGRRLGHPRMRYGRNALSFATQIRVWNERPDNVKRMQPRAHGDLHVPGPQHPVPGHPVDNEAASIAHARFDRNTRICSR